MPKISVIIPCYNAGEFLSRSINSVLQNDLQDIEIIAINDGSTDNTLEILGNFSDDRLSIIDQPNSGASAARNAGINKASGEFVLFLDSDDFLCPNILNELYQNAIKFDADIVFGDFNYYYDESKVIAQTNYETNSGLVDKERFLFDYFTISKSVFPCIWGKIIKTSLLKDNNLKFIDKVFVAEDANLNAKLIWLAQKIVKINKSICNYQIGSNNSSKQMKFKHFSDVRIVQSDLERFFDKFSLNDTQKAYVNAYFLNLKYAAALTLKPYSFDDYGKVMEFACADIKTAFKSSGFKLLNKKLKILFYLFRFSFSYKIYAKIIGLKFK